MADENRLRPALDARLKRQEIRLPEDVHRPFVNGDAGVRVHVIAVAGEVLEHHAGLVADHLRDHRADVFAGLLGVHAEAARVNEIARVGRNVAHGRKINIDT